MPRIAFVLEQALGHVTHSRNLYENITPACGIDPAWAPIPWDVSGWAGKVPLYRSNWTVRAGLRARRALSELQRQAPLDGILFHTQVTAVLAQNWLRRIPSVVSLDATPKQYDALGDVYAHEPGPRWLEAIKDRANQACYANARHLVTWSAWAKASLVHDYGLPESKITVIPPGVNSAAWAPGTPRELRGGPVRILFVGGNLERKGGTHLLEAVARMGDLDVQLDLVTWDSPRPQPRVQVHQGLQPNSPELMDLYHAADIFCLPTMGDCLPMVLSEAGAAGLPVVSTNVAAIPEIVRDGESGLLVPPGDPVALASALRALVENPALRLSMGERAMSIVREQYDAPTNARRLCELLNLTVRQVPEEGANA
jgi:glycosyltransferase involved in cell wall biosynthesis